jgi:hypothetical protein
MKSDGATSIKDRSLFAFRAECSVDTWYFLVRLSEMGQFWVKELKLSHIGTGGTKGHPDCHVEVGILKVNSKFGPGEPYHIPATLSELRRAAGERVDCHVIAESLNYAEKFTGARYYTPLMKNSNAFIDPTQVLKRVISQ